MTYDKIKRGVKGKLQLHEAAVLISVSFAFELVVGKDSLLQGNRSGVKSQFLQFAFPKYVQVVVD